MVNFFIFFTHNLCGSLDPIKMKRMNLCTVHKNSVITRVSEESNHISSSKLKWKRFDLQEYFLSRAATIIN